MKLTSLFGTVTRWSVYLLFVLIPVFFLPWTTNALEINKQFVLVLLALVALTAWLGSMVLTKRLQFRTGLMNLFPALFLAATFVSSLFSLAGYQTWVGQVSQEYVGFLTSAVLVLLLYVIMNATEAVEIQRNVLLCVLVSGAISGSLGVLAMLGWFNLPFDFAHASGFNTVGTLNGFAVYLTAVMFMGLAAWIVSSDTAGRVIPVGGKGLLMRVLIVLVTMTALVTALAVDFWVIWALNILGVLLIAVFAFVQSSAFPEPRRFAFPLVVLFVSVLLLFVRTPLRLSLPMVVSPSYGASWTIARSVLSEGVPRLLLGSGPGTFTIDYAKYHPVEVNQTVFWNLRFDRAKSYAITALATMGVVGLASWLLVMLAAGLSALSRLLKADRDSEAWKMAYVTFVGWMTLFVAHLLYSSNLTLTFLLWGLTGLIAAQTARATRAADFGHSPRMGLGFSFAFVIVAVGVLATLFITSDRYAAEVAFAKAVKLDRSGVDITGVVGELQYAVSRNGWSDVYARNLSSALLVQARQGVAAASGAELTPEQRAEISAQVAGAINAAKHATDIEPNNVSNWVVRGSIYRDVMSFVSNAEDFAAATFQQAIVLEPSNPSHQVNLGRVYLVVSDRAHLLLSAENEELAAAAAQSEVDQLANAEKALLAALQLKPDFGPAHYYLAATYERQGRVDDAISRLVALRNASPNDVGIGFQLAMLYIRGEHDDLARVELERILQVSPNYSNALWYLSALYERAGETDRAILMAERVADLNPGNSAVLRRVEALKAGKAAATIPPPVEEGTEGATAVDGSVTDASSVDGLGVVDTNAGND
ncbi:hypothetical protein A2348_00660 [Candidatus Uhrbacteria bacterium RIFOXYB12_FULL_58_10]|uniref:Uncharacterized protein n=1 Tax=Candidatus Uhrbacteria bacterium RIFOXYB2_FULL_57_15 TaxID=1802422 RepID=A0A1F7W919_9BACT|nr:MAG: hypothetical protein A2348_00660 [Candidatus Uhrbacteria bacterium RIFOXYB12_FULL_58_10]OGL98584.1 MAG: hypothetical protein A2304_00650 [Candidatus Uhrbacteria bacterium RIFOXYB2_FULL_57_15]OGL99113.1 MAG: hypothetical protein A2501_00505 [Candidatus Uhrbacteria bacterium RIFOXYC12_FULL_57_11]